MRSTALVRAVRTLTVDMLLREAWPRDPAKKGARVFGVSLHAARDWLCRRRVMTANRPLKAVQENEQLRAAMLQALAADALNTPTTVLKSAERMQRERDTKAQAAAAEQNAASLQSVAGAAQQRTAAVKNLADDREHCRHERPG